MARFFLKERRENWVVKTAWTQESRVPATDDVHGKKLRIVTGNTAREPRVFDCRIDKESIALRISSEKALVERAVKSCKHFLRQHQVMHTEDITIVLRELTMNAMEHGNQNRPECEVACRVEHLGEHRFKIVVQDEGPGFNAGAIRMAVPDDPRRLQNRGYVLINSLSEKLEFNEKGNCVTAYVAAAADTEQIVKEAHT